MVTPISFNRSSQKPLRITHHLPQTRLIIHSMQTSTTSFSSLATACASQQAAHFEDKPHDNPSLEAPANVDVDMLALSANLFSYLEDASTAAEAGQDLKPVDANDVENMGLSPGSVKAGRPSAAGPLRHRRGYQDRQLSINSFASNTSNSDPNRQGPASNDSNEAKTSTSTEHRVVKVGDHAFTIPMSSPIIPPQLQANVRMTSTGRPSHARKVPEDHVKVSPNTRTYLIPPLSLSPSASSQCIHPV